MAAFIVGCGTSLGSVNALRVASAPAIVPRNRFIQVQKRVRFHAVENDRPKSRMPVQMAEDSPPINAPSGLLLLSSSVLAVASVGCVFELTGGHPTYGPSVTSAILAVSLPSFLFLFYSAIRKGQQEALDDP